MTPPDVIDEIDSVIHGWQQDEIQALRTGDSVRVHDCRLVSGVLLNLKATLQERPATV